MMKPKLITKKTASKHCPSCKQQIPVACKTCTCGHRFTKSISVSEDAEPEPTVSATPSYTTRRRTERIKRERPNFYDSLEYVTPPTTRRRRTVSASLSSDGGDTSVKKRPRGRPKQLKTKQPKDEDSNEGSSSTSSREKEEDMFSSISADKALQFAVVLSEINRKYATQNLKL